MKNKLNIVMDKFDKWEKLSKEVDMCNEKKKMIESIKQSDAELTISIQDTANAVQFKLPIKFTERIKNYINEQIRTRHIKMSAISDSVEIDRH